MGERGPLPTSDNVLAMRGTKDRARPVRPRAVPAIPARARWLEAEAKAEWDRIAPELERMGLLSKLDRATLHNHCVTWAKWVAVSKAVMAEMYEDPKHPGRGAMRKSPLWAVYLSLSKDLIAGNRELGLTPASRLRMSIPEPEEDDTAAILDG